MTNTTKPKIDKLALAAHRKEARAEVIAISARAVAAKRKRGSLIALKKEAQDLLHAYPLQPTCTMHNLMYTTKEDGTPMWKDHMLKETIWGFIRLARSERDLKTATYWESCQTIYQANKDIELAVRAVEGVDNAVYVRELTDDEKSPFPEQVIAQYGFFNRRTDELEFNISNALLRFMHYGAILAWLDNNDMTELTQVAFNRGLLLVSEANK